MCGRFYIDDETAREIEKIALDQKVVKFGDVHHSEHILVLKAQKGEMLK